MDFIDAVRGAVIVAITILVVAAFLALPVMLLWNMVIPELFGVMSINFRQALCLALLGRCLFGWNGFGVKRKSE